MGAETSREKRSSSSAVSSSLVQGGIPPGTTDLEQIFTFGRTLGKGHFATVKEAVHKGTNKVYAIKIINRNQIKNNEVNFKAEIEILKQVGSHPHVVSMIDSFQDDKHFYIIMDYCAGGDLFSQIVEEGKYSERSAIRFCRQMASALKYIHAHGVCHRDLKPENLLLTSRDLETADVKLADFGLSKVIENETGIMHTICGTWAYCAPEVISKQPYDFSVDTWALGVLMFVLLSGYHPFDVYGDTPEPELLRKIKSGRFDFNDPAWDDVSQQAKDLIKGLLVVEPRKRMRLDDYLASAWIMSEGNSQLRPQVVDRMKTMRIRTLVTVKLAADHWKNVAQSRTPRGGSQLQTPRGTTLTQTPRGSVQLHIPRIVIVEEKS